MLKRLSRTDWKAIEMSLNDHLAGDPDDLFDDPHAGDRMQAALDKVQERLQ